MVGSYICDVTTPILTRSALIQVPNEIFSPCFLIDWSKTTLNFTPWPHFIFMFFEITKKSSTDFLILYFNLNETYPTYLIMNATVKLACYIQLRYARVVLGRWHNTFEPFFCPCRKMIDLSSERDQREVTFSGQLLRCRLESGCLFVKSSVKGRNSCLWSITRLICVCH